MKEIAIWQLLNFLRQGVPASHGAPIWRALTRVRQMVLLAEERDLRQVPDAALHIDAVRLLTVHASKGLEFEAVHIPGMTVSNFPAQNRASICPPPRGLMNATGVSQAEEEEECLFFVAVSRARTHLRLYAARRMANGNKRSPSRFLDWMTNASIDELAAGSVPPVPGGGYAQLEVAWSDDWSISGSKLRSYDRCPRRFYYSHILDVGTKRVPTAYSRTEECIYEVIRWYATARIDPAIGEAEALSQLNNVWPERGPVGHAFEADYRALAERLIRNLCASGSGLKFESPDVLTVDLEGQRLIVEPDEVARSADGSLVLRRVRTGYQRTNEKSHVDYEHYHLAGRASSGPGYGVEAVHLTDGKRQPIEFTAKALTGAATSSASALAAIRAGTFPPEPDAYYCPQCPHFFICPTVPACKLPVG
jgi:DNA helicase-2/ATP-dependent DNA helicase PcrA